MLGVILTVALALLRPLPSRAAAMPPTSGPSPTSAEEPPPLSGAVTRRHKQKRKLTRRAKRHLAAVRRAEHKLAVGRNVARYARHLLGVPYRYGGTSPRTGFDCSGLVRYVYSHFGISLAHSSFADMIRGHRV
ncbi:MAG TPA: NlpC/P60 family protein, partial [Gaiellaceae bacterium]|nr:NlpC/P60 family protein [Gaiellaceae bacterium]